MSGFYPGGNDMHINWDPIDFPLSGIEYIGGYDFHSTGIDPSLYASVRMPSSGGITKFFNKPADDVHEIFASAKCWNCGKFFKIVYGNVLYYGVRKKCPHCGQDGAV